MGILVYTSVAILAIVAYLGFEFMQILSFGNMMDEFKQSDLSSCSYVPEIKGCEDLAIHHASGMAFIGCPEDYTLHKNYLSLGYNPRDALVLSSMSYFYSYDLETKKVIKLETKGFPSGVKFGVHGIDILVDPTDSSILHLFAVSHRENGIVVIEHFTHTLGTASITYKETFESPDLKNANAVAAVTPSSFYFTQDLSHSTGILNMLETAGMVAGGRIMFRDESGSYREVARGLKFANGISLSSDRKLVYAVETMAAMLRVYERDENQIDLELKEKVPLRFSPDNIHVDPASGHVYVSGFPLQLDALKKLCNYDGTTHTDTIPSISARVSNETGEDRFFGRNYKVEPVIMDDGGKLFSTTASASDEERGVLLMSGLFTSKGMMDCRMKL